MAKSLEAMLKEQRLLNEESEVENEIIVEDDELLDEKKLVKEDDDEDEDEDSDEEEKDDSDDEEDKDDDDEDDDDEEVDESSIPSVDFKPSVAKGGPQKPNLMSKVKGSGNKVEVNKKTPTDTESYDNEEPNFDPEVVADMKKDKTVKKLTKEDISDDTREHLDSLFSGEELSEEFSAKVREMFEASVLVTAQKVLDEAHEELLVSNQSYLDEALSVCEQQVQEYKEVLAERCDKYFEFVSERWIAENKEAVHSKLRSELNESFLQGLQNLFIEHYIDVPDDKLDILEHTMAQLEEASSDKDELFREQMELRNEIKEIKKEYLIREFTRDLTDTETEKFYSLAEHFSYENDETFVSKLEDIKETYFDESKVVVESTIDDETPLDLNEEFEVKDTSNNAREYDLMLMNKYFKK